VLWARRWTVAYVDDCALGLPRAKAGSDLASGLGGAEIGCDDVKGGVWCRPRERRQQIGGVGRACRDDVGGLEIERLRCEVRVLCRRLGAGRIRGVVWTIWGITIQRIRWVVRSQMNIRYGIGRMFRHAASPLDGNKKGHGNESRGLVGAALLPTRPRGSGATRGRRMSQGVVGLTLDPVGRTGGATVAFGCSGRTPTLSWRCCDMGRWAAMTRVHRRAPPF
jgi:hypothetical protein